MLAHAHTLTHARSCLAGLANAAAASGGLAASSAYERVLIDLDELYADDVPALSTEGQTDDRAILYACAGSALRELVDHGTERLQIELILDALEDAYALDAG